MSYFQKFPDPAKPKKVRSWDLTDAAVLLGLGLVVAGIALVSKPVALIVGGLALVALAIFLNGGQ